MTSFFLGDRPTEMGMFSIHFLLFLLLTTWQSPIFSQDNGSILTLDQAVQVALANNPSFRAAKHSVRASQLRTRKAKSDLFPKADLHFGYTRLDPGTVRRGNVFVEPARALVENFGSGDPADVRPAAYRDNFFSLFQIVQPIYNGGATWAAISSTEAMETASGESLENRRQEVILSVKTRYFRALQAKELVTLAQKNLHASQSHLSTAKNMLEVGLTDRTDVLRWEVQEATHEGEMVEAENKLQVAFAALKQAMGVPYERTFELVPLAVAPQPLTDSMDIQLNEMKLKHPGLKAMTATVDAQKAGVRAATAAMLPKVNFVYELSWEENSTFALDSFSLWRAGFSFQLPLFHSFKNIAGIQEAKAELNRVIEGQLETESLLNLELVRARSTVESSLQRFRIATKAVELALENLRILNNTYAVGLATNLDVLDAEVVHSRAETELIASRYDYWIARAELDRATGILTK